MSAFLNELRANRVHQHIQSQIQNVLDQSLGSNHQRQPNAKARLPIEIQAKEAALRMLDQLNQETSQLDNSLIQTRAEVNSLNNQIQAVAIERDRQLQQKETLIDELTSEKVNLIAQKNLANTQKELLQQAKDNLEIEKQSLSQELLVKTELAQQLRQQTNDASVLQQENENLQILIEEVSIANQQQQRQFADQIERLTQENSRLQNEEIPMDQIIEILRNLQLGSQAGSVAGEVLEEYADTDDVDSDHD